MRAASSPGKNFQPRFAAAKQNEGREKTPVLNTNFMSKLEFIFIIPWIRLPLVFPIKIRALEGAIGTIRRGRRTGAAHSPREISKTTPKIWFDSMSSF
jgi:hypothetical protein